MAKAYTLTSVLRISDNPRTRVGFFLARLSEEQSTAGGGSLLIHARNIPCKWRVRSHQGTPMAQRLTYPSAHMLEVGLTA